MSWTVPDKVWAWRRRNVRLRLKPRTLCSSTISGRKDMSRCVVPPAVTRASQKRYRQSGARTDESDAFLLADLLRTSGHQLHPWRPDSLLTRRIRAQVSLIDGLTRTSVSLSNRLRSLLSRYHPAPLQAFGSLQTPFALSFIQAYPTPQSVQNLTPPELRSFARAQRYTRHSYLPKLFARLQRSLPAVEEATSQIFAGHAPVLASLLKETLQAKKQALRDLRHLFEQHPDREIYQSLPGAEEYLAPALLADQPTIERDNWQAMNSCGFYEHKVRAIERPRSKL